MKRTWVYAVLIAASMVSATVAALPKRSSGCPRRAPKDGAACKPKSATCPYRCEGEGHRDRVCTCEQSEGGAWRWQCADVGTTCVL